MVIKEPQKDLVVPSFVKVVADIERNVLSYGCELHIDCAEELMRDGSVSGNLWGANVYFEEKKIDCVSLINIRPLDNNRSMRIELPDIKEEVERIIKLLIPFQ